ncbi:MAG: SLC13 family permease [Pelovirga sp.]
MDSSILIVLAILAVTVFLLVLDVVRIDVVAMLSMLALAWSGVLAPHEALSGFSSNAVVAMMAVMIMGRGVARTGLMDGFARAVVTLAGAERSKLVGLISVPVGIMSGLIQNIGAVALFLPGVLDIARRNKIAPSALIMPIGFAAILGGTLTMVGSGPLILINDLLRGADLAPYGLLSVTPVGLVLLSVGISYFMIFGRFVLPSAQTAGQRLSEQEQLIASLRLPHQIRHYRIPHNSSLQGKTPEEAGVWGEYQLNILGLSANRHVEYAPWRETMFQAGQVLALLGGEDHSKRFAATYGLVREEKSAGLARLGDPGLAGFAEVIIPPRSAMIGRSIRKYSLRKRYAVEPVMLFSKGEEIRGDFSDHGVISGDTFIVHGLWENISELKESSDFVVATPFVVKKTVSSKALWAGVCFVLAIALTFAGSPISITFMTGAIAMVLLRVLSIQQAYAAIDWKVVFLLAGLIPLGLAMQKTGTAVFLAEQVMGLIQDTHPVFIVVSVAVLATAFSLLISNVGAIVVLAPLVMSMATIGNFDPRALTLMAAVCAANSFILPTHQVNAMIMSVGGYRNADYFKAGIGLTLIFILVVVTVFYVFYL